MGFSRQEYRSGLHFLLQGILLTQGWNPRLLHWQADSLPLSPAFCYHLLIIQIFYSKQSSLFLHFPGDSWEDSACRMSSLLPGTSLQWMRSSFAGEVLPGCKFQPHPQQELNVSLPLLPHLVKWDQTIVSPLSGHPEGEMGWHICRTLRLLTGTSEHCGGAITVFITYELLVLFSSMQQFFGSLSIYLKNGDINISALEIVQSLRCVQLFATPWATACQPPLSFTISWSLLKFMSIELVTLSNHFILCPPSSPFAFNLSQHQGLFQWVASGGQSIGASASASVLPMRGKDSKRSCI